MSVKEIVKGADLSMSVYCEVMLLNWADGPGGATVKFLLDAALDDHPFMACTRRAGDTMGTAFMCALLELDDDDAVINQAKRERFEKARQTLSNVAAMMVKHPHFHAFLRETVSAARSPRENWNAHSADEWLKESLDINSKADLDGDDAEAQHKFLKLHAKYVDWLDASGRDRGEM